MSESGVNIPGVGRGDGYAQAKRALTTAAWALEQAGASMAHVVRTRMFVTDISRWEEVGRAHGEAFGHALPAATMVQVAALIDPGMLVEIDVEAYVPAKARGRRSLTR